MCAAITVKPVGASTGFTVEKNTGNTVLHSAHTAVRIEEVRGVMRALISTNSRHGGDAYVFARSCFCRALRYPVMLAHWNRACADGEPGRTALFCAPCRRYRIEFRHDNTGRCASRVGSGARGQRRGLQPVLARRRGIHIHTRAIVEHFSGHSGLRAEQRRLRQSAILRNQLTL